MTAAWVLVLLSSLVIPLEASIQSGPSFSASAPAYRHRLIDVPKRDKITPSWRAAAVDDFRKDHHNIAVPLPLLTCTRGGQVSSPPNFVNAVNAFTNVIICLGKILLPPVVASVRLFVSVYRTLPVDTICLQVGLVYCFAGGYYPALFSALQAVQHFGLQTVISAIEDLTDEALRIIDATSIENSRPDATRGQVFREKTSIIMATVDPWKINQAAGALYTTWLGVSTVLEREYVRVITLSMTMAGVFERAARIVLAPPAYLCVEEKYHRWVPVVIGWGCKALAMNVAWRLQRVLTAGTSAMTGGLMVSRALVRILSKRGVRVPGLVRIDEQEHQESPFDEAIGIVVGGLGFFTQIKSQYKRGFSFKVPFPANLVTRPFDLAERWIQWQITR